ncbi:hypothetical protein RRG08_014221 [Elysia crispata]|uniref:Uncharacterized protein n=1 Tax=Elysia crispata TaxID=231223 RepID=A0AAE0XEM9_9GAST|nr:hypothetical protein RRG08_014221 [Elysia crispata]
MRTRNSFFFLKVSYDYDIGCIMSVSSARGVDVDIANSESYSYTTIFTPDFLETNRTNQPLIFAANEQRKYLAVSTRHSVVRGEDGPSPAPSLVTLPLVLITLNTRRFKPNPSSNFRQSPTHPADCRTWPGLDSPRPALPPRASTPISLNPIMEKHNKNRFRTRPLRHASQTSEIGFKVTGIKARFQLITRF